MAQIVSSFNNLIGKLLKKFYSLSLPAQIIAFYTAFSVPFIYYHENHLPFLIIFILMFIALSVGSLLVLLSLAYLRLLFGQDGINILYEILLILVGLIIVYFLGLLDNRAGVLFVFIISIIYGFFRFLEIVILYRIILFGLIILLNGMLTFKTLQSVELFIFNYNVQDKYDIEGPDPILWKVDEKNSIVTHETLGVYFKLPEGFFFHNPKDLKFSEKSGAGKFLGVVSSSLEDPNTYPLFRMFYLPLNMRIMKDEMSDEFYKFLDFEANRGEIESVQNMGPHTLEEKKWEGNFWIFYDALRPRNAKSGFYIVPLKDGAHLILTLRETLLETDFHEKDILEILNSFTIP